MVQTLTQRDAGVRVAVIDSEEVVAKVSEVDVIVSDSVVREVLSTVVIVCDRVVKVSVCVGLEVGVDSVSLEIAVGSVDVVLSAPVVLSRVVVSTSFVEV